MAQNELHTNVAFETVGQQTDTIDVKISHRIIQLFSEGLYSSSSKAVEELVSNSFDAGAQNVHVIISPDLQDPDATIVVLDDGRVRIEMLGGQSHYGVVAYAEDFKEPYEDFIPGHKKLIDGLWFYSDFIDLSKEDN